MENLKVIISDDINDKVVVSTATNLGVNRIDDCYVIIFSPETFESMHDYISQLGVSIVKMFNANLPDKDVLMSIVVNVSHPVSNKFHETLVAFANIAGNFNKFSRIQYIGCNDLNGDDDEEEEENIVDVEESADDIRNRLMSQIEAEYESSDDEDFDDDEEEDDDEDASDIEDEFDFGYTNKMYTKKNKSKSKKPYYGTSRIWKNSDNIKRSIKRHGVVVTDSKKDVRSDEKIIKEFLKDFIPGGADWKKDFRKEVLERWMHCYAIEKKRLKKYEKKARKHAHKKRAIDPNKAVEFTKRLFYTPIDKWADPSR